MSAYPKAMTLLSLLLLLASCFRASIDSPGGAGSGERPPGPGGLSAAKPSSEIQTATFALG